MEKDIKRKVSFVIPGKPVRKSNNRMIVTTKSGMVRSIKSETAQRYYKLFSTFVPDEYKLSMEGPIGIEVIAYYSPSRTHTGKIIYALSRNPIELVCHPWIGDLSVEAIMDCLQRSGVILDDRQIISVVAKKAISFDNPRVEITVIEYNDTISIAMEPPGFETRV